MARSFFEGTQDEVEETQTIEDVDPITEEADKSPTEEKALQTQPQPQPLSSESSPIAGNLSRYLINWHSITQNNFILNIIKFGYKIQLISSKLNIPPVKSFPSKANFFLLLNEIQKLLKSGVISEVKPKESDIVSRIFNVPKPNGDCRMIIDLSTLNKSVVKSSFRMEDIKLIKTMVQKGDFLVSLDLKDAFHSIPLNVESRRLTCFDFNGKRYCFNVLAFGLTSSPRIFTRVLKPVISYLRLSGLRITAYLDDILICSYSYSKCLEDLNKAKSLLVSLGFNINLMKSKLIPSNSISHLGYIWNSIDMTISLPEDKLEKIKKLSDNCLKYNCSLRSLAALLGLYVSAGQGYLYAPLRYRSFQIFLISKLKCYDNWDSIVKLSNEARHDILWWLNVSLSDLKPNPISHPKPDVSLFTDASLVGWGAFLSSGEYISGTWNDQEKSEHINYLELKAVFLAVSYFSNVISNKNVLIRCDNISVVYYINKMGGTHSKKLCLLSVKTWKLFTDHSISCFASHISGINNKMADFLSRYSFNHEYHLCPKAFKYLLEIIPFSLDIDLFASKSNKKLNSFYSINKDYTALGLDAFNFVWSSNLYAFPPIPLISKTISKLKQDEVEFCLLITPAWDSLAFIPLLKSMLIFNPIMIPSNYLLGYLPTRHRFHLMAWCISAKYVRNKKFLKTCQMPSSKVSPLLPSNLIPGSGQTLFTGLRKENLVPLCLEIL